MEVSLTIVKPNDSIQVGFDEHVSADGADDDVPILDEHDTANGTDIAGAVGVDNFDNRTDIKHVHCADTIKKGRLVVKPPCWVNRTCVSHTLDQIPEKSIP